MGVSEVEPVAEMLDRDYPGVWLIVELALVRPGDPGVPENDSAIVISEGAPCIVVSGGEVFAMCSLDGPSDTIVDALLVSPAVCLYRAFIMKFCTEVQDGVLLSDLLDLGEPMIMGILVGAYDGEGYVFARQDRSGSVAGAKC